jgi:hypothetical protein
MGNVKSPFISKVYAGRLNTKLADPWIFKSDKN